MSPNIVCKYMLCILYDVFSEINYYYYYKWLFVCERELYIHSMGVIREKRTNENKRPPPVDWYSGVRAIGPEYGRLYRFGLNNDIYYVCKLRGLSALSGERDSLLRCVGGVGEAGASYVNKWFNCNQELFLLFPSPLGSATFWCPWPGLNFGGIRGSAEWRKISSVSQKHDAARDWWFEGVRERRLWDSKSSSQDSKGTAHSSKLSKLPVRKRPWSQSVGMFMMFRHRYTLRHENISTKPSPLSGSWSEIGEDPWVMRIVHGSRLCTSPPLAI